MGSKLDRMQHSRGVAERRLWSWIACKAGRSACVRSGRPSQHQWGHSGSAVWRVREQCGLVGAGRSAHACWMLRRSGVSRRGGGSGRECSPSRRSGMTDRTHTQKQQVLLDCRIAVHAGHVCTVIRVDHPCWQSNAEVDTDCARAAWQWCFSYAVDGVARALVAVCSLCRVPLCRSSWCTARSVPHSVARACVAADATTSNSSLVHHISSCVQDCFQRSFS